MSHAWGEAIALFSMEGKVVRANQPYLDMLGYKLKEIRKKTYQELTPGKWHEIEEDIRANQVMSAATARCV